MRRPAVLLPVLLVAAGAAACGGSHPHAGSPRSAPPVSVAPLPPSTGSGAHPSSPTPSTRASASASASVPSPETTASRPPIAGPLAFAWTVAVSGRVVTVGGAWRGVDRTVTTAQVGAGTNLSTGVRAGSGVLGWDGTVLTAGGAPVPAGTAPDEADFAVSPFQTDGGIPPCRGSVRPQARVIPPMRLTFARPGTYELRMSTISCAGRRTDSKVFSVR